MFLTNLLLLFIIDCCSILQVVTEIERNVGNNRQKIEVTGLMESDPEYQLIVEANNIAVEIDGEISK